MPITAAATSMSRIAIHSRPMWLRTRFLASSANTATKPRQNRYFCGRRYRSVQPKTFSSATPTEPDDELLVNHLMRRNAQSKKNCAASVATARYRPLMRSDGMPNSTPDDGGAHTAEQDGQDQRHAVDAHQEVVGRIGAHGHEGTGAQRNLAAIADQDVQPERRQRKDQKRNQDGAEQIFAGDEGHDQKAKATNARISNPVLRDREDLLIGAVVGLELTVFSVKHGFSRCATGTGSLCQAARDAGIRRMFIRDQ